MKHDLKNLTQTLPSGSVAGKISNKEGKEQLSIPKDLYLICNQSIIDWLFTLSNDELNDFVQEFNRKKYRKIDAFVLALLGLSHAYLGQRGVQLIFWITGGGLGVWALIQLFIVSKSVENKNRDVCMNLVKDYKLLLK